MPTYIVVKAVAALDSDDEMVYQKGYIVDVFDRDVMDGRVVLPKFCQFCIDDEDDHESVKQIFNVEWKKEIDWAFVGHDYSIDGHRLRVFMNLDVVSSSGLNSITRSQAESFLNKWNAEIHSTSTNSVIFDVIVFDAIKSQGFWDVDLPLLAWTENNYDQETGIHSIEVDYSAYSFTSEKVSDAITKRGGVVTETSLKKTTFDINRSDVFVEFKADVKDAIESSPYSRKQFKVPDNFVQTAVEAGGTFHITRNQFDTYIHNRIND